MVPSIENQIIVEKTSRAERYRTRSESFVYRKVKAPDLAPVAVHHHHHHDDYHDDGGGDADDRRDANLRTRDDHDDIGGY
ncbi:hypothetical protein AKJ16_DCAP19758, partial [Drosera capensis]